MTILLTANDSQIPLDINTDLKQHDEVAFVLSMTEFEGQSYDPFDWIKLRGQDDCFFAFVLTLKKTRRKF